MLRLRVLLVFLLAVCMTRLSNAQTIDFTIDYGETQSAIFDGDGFSQIWIFSGDAGDILTIRAYRIAGQFTPRIRLLDAFGDVLAESDGTAFSDYDELVFRAGLPESDFGATDIPFQIEISGIDITSNQRDNPAEYSITLDKTGERRTTRDEGLTPLPQIDPDLPPTLQSGNATRINLGFDVYGATPDVVQANTSNVPVRWLVQTARWQLAVNNAIPVLRGVVSATFLGSGIGLTVNNETLLDRDTPATFFANEDFMVAYDSNRRIYTLTMASGQTIITDFFQLIDLQVIDGTVIARVQTEQGVRRFFFTGDLVDIRRLAGGEGNEEAIVRINLEDDQSIVTDFEGYDTLAYIDGQLRALYGDDARFITEQVRLDLRQDNNDRDLHEIVFLAPTADGDTQSVEMLIDWSQMGDVRVTGQDVLVDPIDSRALFEPIRNLREIVIDEGGVRFARLDGTYRTSLPDGTTIDTPAQLPDNADLLPHQAGFRPRNYNNLGADILALCDCVTDFIENQPINPANGNFFYSVTDFDIPSHTLNLNLTRYYNSQAIDLTPRYMLDSPAGYPVGQMSDGWRHSYQYELDIRGAPTGRVRLIMPDSTQHLFFPVANAPNTWRSRTLITWVLTQTDTIGTWQAVAADGTRYYFDRAGRIERISNAPDRSITISPLPAGYDILDNGGAFVIDPYGRRLELYTGASGNIEIVRDPSARQITYTYNDAGQLTNVEYLSSLATASYTYNETGALARYDDARSPYVQVAQLEYDASRRITRYTENPDGLLSREARYSYDRTDDGRTTTRTRVVSGEQRRVTWTYNDLYQLVGRTTPRDDHDYEFTYDVNSGTLTSYRMPTLVRYRTTFDGRGNLTRFEDPFFIGEGAYNFTYEQRNGQSLLTRITYPNGGEDVFTWSAGDDPQLIAHQQLVSIGLERVTRTTRFEYDDFGRLVMRVAPNKVATIYQYDAFGYVSTVWAGVRLQADETRADITDSSRALRVLRYDYDLIGQIRAITDGRGQTYTLSWDSSFGKLRQVTLPNGVATTYSYDERGRVTLVNDRGQETQYTYDGLDNISGKIDSAGVILTFAYDEAGNLLQIVDDLQRTTSFRYDELDNPVERVSPAGFVTRFETITEQDFVIRREIDPQGRVFTRRYDVLGRLRRYTLSDGEFQQEFRINYNSVNRPTEIIEAQSGRTLTIEYDLIGQVRAVDVAGARTTFAYDGAGQLIQVTSPAERVTSYAYDALGNIVTVTLPDESQLTYDYDENSNLLSASDDAGLVTNYVYNAINQLVSVEDSGGITETYDYDERGNLTTIINPNSISRNFEYDVLDRLVAATDGRGQTTNYQYDELGRLFNIQQPGVRSTRLTYDAEDNIIAVTERPREQRTLYSYDALGRISSITDPLGHTTSYSYNPVGRISRVIDALGNEVLYQWRPGVQTLTRYTDQAGRSYDFNTDALGRVSLIRDRITEQNVALNTQFTYDADGYVQGIQIGTDSARTSGVNDTFYQYAYTADGAIVRYTDPSEGDWLIEYDGSGNVMRVTNPLGVPTAYVRDASGRITAVIKQVDTAQETIEQYTYDPNGNITRYVAPDGTINTYIYDRNDRLVQAVLAEGTPQESRYIFEYNALGQLIRTEDPNGVSTQYIYLLDELARVERTLTTADGETTTLSMIYNYDDSGNLRNVVFPGRNEATRSAITVNMTYDALDRRVRYVDGEDSVWSYTYNAAGNIAQISDPLGSVVRYSYDNYDRVTRITYPTGAAVDFAYDTAGNLRSVTLPPNLNDTEQQVIYVLDVMGNITQMQVGTNITRYEYDVMGNLTRRIAPDGRITTYTYDAANRLAQMSYDNGQVVDYSYDRAGNVTSAGNLRFEYDALGRVIAETSGDFRIEYSYDAVGNLLSRSAGAFGTMTYTYDDLYRPTRVDFGDRQVEMVYDEMSRVRQLIRSNGVTTINNYDAVGRPLAILHFAPPNERLDGFNYQYDAVGNLIRVDRIVDGWRINYAYDVSHRLIDERWVNEIGETKYAVSFRYDEAGNRIEELRNGRRTVFRYNDRNQLVEEVRDFNPQNDNFLIVPAGIVLMGALGLSRRRHTRALLALPILALLGMGGVLAQTTAVTTVRYDYSTNGNLTRVTYVDADTQLDLSYDAENRLVAIVGQNERGEPVDVELTYDLMSRLISWRDGARTYRLVYDGRDLIGMTDEDGNIFERYIALDGERLLTLRGDDAFWHLKDHIDSTRRYASAEGALIDAPDRFFEFGSFGVRIFPYDEGIPPEGAQVDVPTPFFAGYLYDPAIDLYHIGLRSYDARFGRFLQTDPVRQDPVGTLYTYARNRPFVFSDETGMMVDPFVDPTNAAVLAQDLEPESLLPRPDVLDIPAPPATHQLQADETVRALQLLDDMYYGINETVLQVSPLYDELYLLEANPVPATVREQVADPLRQMMSIYEHGTGWLPDPRTDPAVPLDAFSLLHESENLLAQATFTPFDWGDDPQQTALMPMIDVPQGLPPRLQIAQDLFLSLQQVSIMSGLEPQTARLIDPRQIDPAPELALPRVQVPELLIEPPILRNLDALREESYDLTEPIWSLGMDDCRDCLSPLRFSR